MHKDHIWHFFLVILTILLAVTEEDAVPFDKEHIRSQLEAGGGVVLEKYSEREVSVTVFQT